jgi:hypothetical protein
MTPRFSRFAGGLRVGADYFERQRALAVDGAPRGLVDRIDDLANPAVDVRRIHPAVVAFFEDTASLDLFVRSRWRFPFSVVWRLFRFVLAAIGQFVLPLDEARIRTRVLAIDRARDGREDARAVIRTYADTGDVMQAVAYATWHREGTRYMSAAFPMPGGHVAGVLRLDAIDEDDDGRLAVALTSRARDGDDAGVWLVLGSIGVPSPFHERLELWPAGAKAAPPELDVSVWPGATIVGRHEQRLFGIRFVTHHYWFRPAAHSRGGARDVTRSGDLHPGRGRRNVHGPARAQEMRNTLPLPSRATLPSIADSGVVRLYAEEDDDEERTRLAPDASARVIRGDRTVLMEMRPNAPPVALHGAPPSISVAAAVPTSAVVPVARPSTPSAPLLPAYAQPVPTIPPAIDERPAAAPAPRPRTFRGVAIALAIGLAFVSGIAAALAFASSPFADHVQHTHEPRAGVTRGATLRLPDHEVKAEGSGGAQEGEARPAAPKRRPRAESAPADVTGRDLLADGLGN